MRKVLCKAIIRYERAFCVPWLPNILPESILCTLPTQYATPSFEGTCTQYAQHENLPHTSGLMMYLSKVIEKQ